MGSGILGLIGNYVGARHERQNKKDQEALLRFYQAWANQFSPTPQKYMANAQADIHASLADLVGDKEYKEHQPFVQRMLEGIGNTVIGTMSGTMPMWGQHIPQIPTAIDPNTGQPVVGMGAPPGQQGPPTQPGAADTSQVFPGFKPGIQGIPDTERQQIAGQLASLSGTAQQPQAQAGPLPGGTTPASTLAPPTTEGGVTPATATGLIGKPGKGGFYELPQDIKDVGTEEFLKAKGKFGKTPQEIQGIIDTYKFEVQAGRMSSEQAIAAIQKSIQAYTDPSTRAGAEPATKEVYYEEKRGGQPLILEEKRDGTLRGEYQGKYRTDLTHDELIQGGYTRTTRPPADIPKMVSVPANDPNFRAYLQSDPRFANIDLDQFAPDQKFNIARANRGAGEFTGFPTLDATSAGSRNIEAQMIQAAENSLEERNPQTGQWGKVSPATARAYAGKMFLERIALMNARMKNGLDVSAYKWGITVPASQLPEGLRVKGGGPSVELGKEPALGDQGGAQGGGAGDAGDAAAARMQALPNPQQGGATSPNVVPGQLPAGAQPAAAGTPGAAPSASTPPQAPATHPQTVQPVTPPPQQGGGQVLIPGSAAAPNSDYIGAYMSSLDPAPTGPKPIQSMVTVGRRMITQRIADIIQRDEGRAPTPEEVSARLSNAETEWGAQLAAQRDNSQRAVLVSGIVDTIDQFAKQYIYQSRQIPDHGSLLANSFDRDIASKFRTNPKLASYKAAGLGLGTTWGTMISQASQSKGQIQEGALKTTLEKISTNAPRMEVAETMSRIVLEGQTERWRYQNQAYKIEQAKAATLLGKISNYGATIGQPPPEPHYAPPPADGTIRKVRGTNQFVHYDAILGRYVAGRS